jgi:hypothetical protein
MRRANIAERIGDSFIRAQLIERLLREHDVPEHFRESPAKNRGGSDFPLAVQPVQFQQFSERLMVGLGIDVLISVF